MIKHGAYWTDCDSDSPVPRPEPEPWSTREHFYTVIRHETDRVRESMRIRQVVQRREGYYVALQILELHGGTIVVG